MSYERITVAGNIGRTEVLTSKAGTPYIRMSVAANRGTGEARQTVWYSVLLYGSLAANPDKLLTVFTSGRMVIVEGVPHSELYERKDGTHAIDHAIIAITRPQVLDAKPKS